MCTYKSNKPWEGAKKKEQVPGRIGELHSLPLGMDLVLRFISVEAVQSGYLWD